MKVDAHRPFALVTGTSAGIGQAVAIELLDRGWQVVGVARRAIELDVHDYHHVRADLGDATELRRVLADLKQWRLSERPRIGLVNNAAILGPVGPITALDPVEFTRTFAVNVTAPAWLTGRLAAAVGDRPLRVVNVSSGAAHKGYPGWSAYCASKAALYHLGRTIGVECVEMPALDGVDLRVVGFAPGVVDTAMQGEIRQCSPAELPRVQRFLDLQSNGDLLPPEAPARAIVELLGRDDLPRFDETRI